MVSVFKEIPGRLMVQMKSDGSSLDNSLLPGRKRADRFVLSSPSTDRTRPIHVVEGNLLYSDVTLIQKHPE